MKIIHLFVFIALILVVLFTFNPGTLENFSELIKEASSGNYGEYTMGGRQYLYGGGNENYKSYNFSYPCKKKCVLGKNNSWGCPITTGEIDDCAFDSDCYDCTIMKNM